MKACFLSLALLLLGTAVGASGADTPSVTNWDLTGNDLVVSCAAAQRTLARLNTVPASAISTVSSEDLTWALAV
jgi:hypothetical protein